MDTKLKKSNSGRAAYGFLFFIEVIIITCVGIAGSMFAALQDMRWMKDVHDGYYYGQITDAARHDWLLNFTGIGMIVGAVIAIGLLILLAVMSGRYAKDEEGRIHLTWFDCIWSEIQAAGAVGLGLLVCLCMQQFYYMWISGDFLGVWELNENISSSIPANVEGTFLVAAMVVLTAVMLLCLMSLIKKFKAHMLWQKSLLGGSILAIYKAVKSSDRTLLKIMIILIAGAFLSATWIGLPFVLVLILIFVPSLVKKFRNIKQGVEEVKNGNLSYKIETDYGEKGIKGELDRLADNINQISRASNIAVQNELKNQRMKTELISNVSHDLKTPLTSMISYVDLMKKEGLDSPNAPEYLDIIDQKTQRLKVLTENLFEAAKASSGAIPVNMEAIDITSLLTQSLAEMEERLSAKSLDVQVKNLCEGTRVVADGQLMWRVIENLLGNVSKYALEGSRVYIDVREISVKGRDDVVLEIKNISRDQLNISAEELMERFKRGDESRNTEGSGLGLAIAKDLVKLMNGIFEITVDGDLFKATVMLEKAEENQQKKTE